MKVFILENIQAEAHFLKGMFDKNNIDSTIGNTEIGASELFGDIQNILNEIGLILMNINLSGIDGIEFCKKLKKNTLTKDIPVIFVITQNHKKKLENIFKAGATDFIFEPYTDHEILPRIKSHLQNYTFVKKIKDANTQHDSDSELEANRHQLQLIFDNAPATMMLVDKNRRILNINKAGLQFTGLSRGEVIETKFGDAIVCAHSLKNPAGCGFSEYCKQCVQRNLILETIKNNKSYTKVEVRLTVVREGKNVEHIVNLSTAIASTMPEETVLLTMDDITSQKKAQQALLESEHTFRMLVENIDEIFWVINIDSKELTYISPNCVKLFELTSDDIYSDYKVVTEKVHPADKQKLEDTFSKILSGENATIEYRLITSNNSIKWLFLKAFGYFDANKNKDLVFGLTSDITNQKLTERRILQAILETENRERETFAKELHDGLGANLSSIKMYLERINSHDLKPEKKESYIQYALELIKLAVSSSKEISYNLKPHTLVNLGLIPSIKLLCEHINGLGDLKITFNHNCENLKIDSEIELAIYRILSELTNNSLKYADAKNINLNLAVENDRLTMNYSDDGKGFDLKEVKNTTGNGMKNIVARTEAFGGIVNIWSKINEGTKITLKLTIGD